MCCSFPETPVPFILPPPINPIPRFGGIRDFPPFPSVRPLPDYINPMYLRRFVNPPPIINGVSVPLELQPYKPSPYSRTKFDVYDESEIILARFKRYMR